MTTATYTTPAQDAKTIRAAIKSELGLNSRQVSVRSECYSMGSSIRVTVKVAGADLDQIKTIAEKCQHIDRDGFGEILSGGNRFVFVQLDHELISKTAAEILPEIEAVDDAMKADPGLTFTIRGVRIFRPSQNPNRLHIWTESDNCGRECWGANAAADAIAHVALVK